MVNIDKLNIQIYKKERQIDEFQSIKYKAQEYDEYVERFYSQNIRLFEELVEKYRGTDIYHNFQSTLEELYLIFSNDKEEYKRNNAIIKRKVKVFEKELDEIKKIRSLELEKILKGEDGQ